mgnify:CR=1 FL=1
MIDSEVIVIILIVFTIFLLLFIILNIKLSRKSKTLIDAAYNSKGNYESFQCELSKHDYNTIVAGSTGILGETSNDYIWEYNVNHIHSISWGFGAYSYINDSCDIYCTDGTHYAGYSNRHIRLEWKWNIKKGKFEAVNVYEYITPGTINSFFDMIS